MSGKTILGVVGGLILALVLCPVFAWAEDAAMVVDQKGAAQYADGIRKGKDVALMDFLAAGEKITLGSGTTLVLNFFASGAREEVSGPGTLIVGEKGATKADGATVKTEKVDYIPNAGGALAADAQHSGVVVMRDMGDQPSEEVAPLNMVNTAARTLPITFHWESVTLAAKYKFTLTDVNDKVLFETTTTKPQAVCDKADLPRGQEIWWAVKVVDGPVSAGGGGQFYLLKPEAAAKLEQSEKAIQTRFPKDQMEARIALALLYQKFELNDEARAVLLDLKVKQPKNGNIDKQLTLLQGNYRPGS
jgi:hypothetical protein